MILLLKSASPYTTIFFVTSNSLFPAIYHLNSDIYSWWLSGLNSKSAAGFPDAVEHCLHICSENFWKKKLMLNSPAFSTFIGQQSGKSILFQSKIKCQFLCKKKHPKPYNLNPIFVYLTNQRIRIEHWFLFGFTYNKIYVISQNLKSQN